MEFYIVGKVNIKALMEQNERLRISAPVIINILFVL